MKERMLYMYTSPPRSRTLEQHVLYIYSSPFVKSAENADGTLMSVQVVSMDARKET